jgi:hypothetical protein
MKVLDKGLDKPGDVHVPEAKENIRYVRGLPLIYKDMFAKLD